MTDFNTATDTEIERLNHLISLMQTVKELDADMYIGAKEVSELLHCSLASARQYMHRPDFPRIECGKEIKVSIIAFHEYNLSRRIQK